MKKIVNETSWSGDYLTNLSAIVIDENARSV